MNQLISKPMFTGTMMARRMFAGGEKTLERSNSFSGVLPGMGTPNSLN